MATVAKFALPDLGEGLTEAEIVQWLVAEGDTITLNQPLVEVETAKATVEIPSPYAGKVAELKHAEGDTVPVGELILIVETDAEEPAGSVDEPPVPQPSEPAERITVLVGSGPIQSDGVRRRHLGSPPADNGRRTEQAVDSSSSKPLAKPPVRKLAKDLNIDLARLTPTGQGGVVTREDVQRAAAPITSAARRMRSSEAEERVRVTGVRRATAEAMVASAFTAPHVTCFLDVDISRGMQVLASLREKKEFRDVRLSPLFLAAKACIAVIARYPYINSTWDEKNGEIVLKRYVNLGIAAATPHGLLVPVVEGADALTSVELAQSLSELGTDAKQGTISPQRTKGGTFTITNIGVFGVDIGTPIIPPGQAAILALGQVQERPWVAQGVVEVRPVVTLALSFDHRIIDGEVGSLFLRDVGAFLEDPAVALLVGS